MNITYKKHFVGAYDILINGEFSGCVTKDECGRWMAAFNEMDLSTGWEVSRKAAVEHLAQMIQEEKDQAAAADQAGELFDPEAEEAAALENHISTKVSKADPESTTSMWMGLNKMELKGSRRLDFIEFMFLESYGSVIDERSFQSHCDRYAEDDGDCSADDHADNFADCWGDYLRQWKAANDGDLCESCKGDGSVKGSETKATIRMITCPDCKGDGLRDFIQAERLTLDLDLDEMAKDSDDHLEKMLKLDLQHFAAPTCLMCGGSGRIADDILCWECDEPLIQDPVQQRDDPVEVVNSLNRALYEIKECGQVWIQDESVKDLVEQELKEMDIRFRTENVSTARITKFLIYQLED